MIRFKTFTTGLGSLPAVLLLIFSSALFIQAPLSLAASIDWSTFLGGYSTEVGRGITMDSIGNAYVVGSSLSGEWITNPNSGAFDAYVIKLSPSGAILWSAFLGGNNMEDADGVALDNAGNVVIAGLTYSSDWISGGGDTTFNGESDAFVVKLTGTGSFLWSTYLGGSVYDSANGIVVDAFNNIYVCGKTASADWISGGIDTTLNGDRDAFAAKLSSSGIHQWSTYIGGDANESAGGIAVRSGWVTITGETNSSNWISNGNDTSFNGNLDGFIIQLDDTGGFHWSTYLGGADNDWGYCIAVDSEGNAFVAGSTYSGGWTQGGLDTLLNDPGSSGNYGDAFLAKYSSSGAHLWSTYMGGAESDWAEGIALDGSGTVYVVGATGSDGWTSRMDTTRNGGRDIFLELVSNSGSFLWSTYLGGAGDDYGEGVALGDGIACVCGTTRSATLVGGSLTSLHGAQDAFVSRISLIDRGSLRVTLTPALAVSFGARWRRVESSDWLSSGMTESNLLTGPCTIEFKSLPGWITPKSINTGIYNKQTTYHTANYAVPAAIEQDWRAYP